MSSAKRKGWAAENEIKNMHLDMSVPCKRVPLSGAATDYKGDIEILEEFTAEVKKRANGQGWTVLERWMQKCQIMFLRRNHQQPMVIMDWNTYAKLIRTYKKSIPQHQIDKMRKVEDDDGS